MLQCHVGLLLGALGYLGYFTLFALCVHKRSILLLLSMLVLLALNAAGCWAQWDDLGQIH
jgi:hypothetical protein